MRARLLFSIDDTQKQYKDGIFRVLSEYYVLHFIHTFIWCFQFFFVIAHIRGETKKKETQKK